MNASGNEWPHGQLDSWMKETNFLQFFKMGHEGGSAFREHGSPPNEKQGQLGFRKAIMSMLPAALGEGFKKSLRRGRTWAGVWIVPTGFCCCLIFEFVPYGEFLCWLTDAIWWPMDILQNQYFLIGAYVYFLQRHIGLRKMRLYFLILWQCFHRCLLLISVVVSLCILVICCLVSKNIKMFTPSVLFPIVITE